MKMAAVVITYNPDNNVIFNILSYSKWVEKIYVLDNTESKNQNFADSISQINNAFYFKYDENMGIGLRLNQACDMARNDRFKYLLTMDQDSSFGNTLFEEYLKKTNEYLLLSDNVAIFAVNYQPDFVPVSNKPSKVLSTITSGSIIDLEVHKKVNGYNEALFLDLVDAEYCYRVHALGYDIILFADIILSHAIGHFINGRSLKNFKVTPRRIHPPVRIYYLVRNSLYLLNKKDLSEEAKKDIRRCFSLLKNNFLYNSKRWTIFKYIVKAYFDSRNNKLGKFKM